MDRSTVKKPNKGKVEAYHLGQLSNMAHESNVYPLNMRTRASVLGPPQFVTSQPTTVMNAAPR